jgi:hypothetical protein
LKYDSPRDGIHHTQLFNLTENPNEFIEQHGDRSLVVMTGIKPEKEQVNLAAEPRYAQKLAEMESLLLSEMRKLDDPYRLWNQPDDGLEPPNPRAQSVKKKSRR